MKRPTDEDRVEALQRFLVGLARGDDANQLSLVIADLHVQHNTFPGEVFMESRYLPEVRFQGKEHRRIQYAVLTPFTVQGGLEPDLLDEMTYWIEQYRQYALFAAVAIVRDCAERSDTPIETLVAELAMRSTIENI